jgi:hypothetical protein
MKLTIKQLLLAFNLFWVAFLPNSVFAEENGCLELKQLWSHTDAVTKASDMTWELKLRAKDCHLRVSLQPSDVWVTNQAQSGFELKLDERSYGKIKRSPTDINSPIADQMNLTLSVKTGVDLTPGLYEAPAVLNYQVIDSKGNLVQESTRIVIPVKVVASTAQVHFKEAPDPWKPLKIAGLVVLAAPLLPAVVGVGIFELITGIRILADC